MSRTQKESISTRACVKRLARKDLEDKFFEIYDENFLIKKENLENREKIKHLAAKLIRSSSNQRLKIKSNEIIYTEDEFNFHIKELENQNIQLNENLENLMMKNFNLKQNDIEINEYGIRSSSSSKESGCLRKNLSTDLQESPKSLKSDSEINEKIIKMQDEINLLQEQLDNGNKVNQSLLSEITELKNQISKTELNSKISNNIKLIDLKRILKETRNEMKILEMSRNEIKKENSVVLEKERKRIGK